METLQPHNVRISDPETDVARRLEYVRYAVDCATLRDFWKRLTRGGEFEVSLQEVRAYHTRENPPSAYLERVAEVFGVNAEWLASGQEEPWRPDGGAQSAAELAASQASQSEFEDALVEAFAQYGQLPPLARATILKTCDRLYRDAQFRAVVQQRTGPSRGYVARFVGTSLARPLVNAVAGSVRTSELHPWQLESYVLGICQGLMALIPNPNWTQQASLETAH